MAANRETITLSKPAERSVKSSQRTTATRRNYLAGSGNQHQSEALPGALPLGSREVLVSRKTLNPQHTSKRAGRFNRRS